MRTALIVLAFACGVVAAASSCFVDRRSSAFECDNDSDCTEFADNRVCDTATGFCVPEQCPSVCNGGCDLKAKTCRVTCPGGSECGGTIHCPDEFDCNINCGSGNACGEVDCSNAAKCTIMCIGTNACERVDCNGPGDPTCNVVCNGNQACGDIQCDGAACQLNCVGTNACGNIDCADSCNCTAACTAQNSCGTVTCPTGCMQGLGCGGCNTCN